MKFSQNSQKIWEWMNEILVSTLENQFKEDFHFHFYRVKKLHLINLLSWKIFLIKSLRRREKFITWKGLKSINFKTLQLGLMKIWVATVKKKKEKEKVKELQEKMWEGEKKVSGNTERNERTSNSTSNRLILGRFSLEEEKSRCLLMVFWIFGRFFFLFPFHFILSFFSFYHHLPSSVLIVVGSGLNERKNSRGKRMRNCKRLEQNQQGFYIYFIYY